jgi:hypothetical protein
MKRYYNVNARECGQGEGRYQSTTTTTTTITTTTAAAAAGGVSVGT